MKIVMLDLDSTLIDSDYKLNTPETDFIEVIEQLSAKDIKVGLCSDSAAITLRQWAQKLKLTGPIIAERGAVLFDPGKNQEIVIQPEKTSWFAELRELFVKQVMTEYPKSTIIIGDATRFVKDGTFNSGFTGDIFAINGFRKASFSMFAYQSSHLIQEIFPSKSRLSNCNYILMDLLDNFGVDKDDLFWDLNFDYGVLIIHDSSSQKSLGIKKIVEQYQPEEVIMVGDGVADYIGSPKVRQFAVGNAKPEYKDLCEFVSSQDLTLGVIDCLKRLL